MMKMENDARSTPENVRLAIRAAVRVCIPAAGLRIWINEGGTTAVSASVTIAPWLSDMSANGGTPQKAIGTTIADGFPLTSICGDHVYACHRSWNLHESLHYYPHVARRMHMAVTDGTQAVRILDLDKARKHHDPTESALVEDVSEPLNQDHSNDLFKVRKQ